MRRDHDDARSAMLVDHIHQLAEQIANFRSMLPLLEGDDQRSLTKTIELLELTLTKLSETPLFYAPEMPWWQAWSRKAAAD